MSQQTHPHLDAQDVLASLVAQRHPAFQRCRASHLARLSLLDTFAVTLAGAVHPASAASQKYAQALEDRRGAPLWWTGRRYPPETAAMLNAVAAHALDYDDTTPAWRGHPGAVLWPAIFALAPQACASLDDLLASFIIGFEVGAHIGRPMADMLYAKGWHTTATIGTIAAAAACAYLLRMDHKSAFNTLGLALVQAAGTQASFGSMAKPVQVGLASAAAVRAAQMAAAGVQAGQVLEGAKGILQLHAERQMLDAASPPAAGYELAIEHEGPRHKQFPACYATHRAIQAALALRSGLDTSQDIEHIWVEGSPGAHHPLIDGKPGTPDAARFSMAYVIACALHTGKVELSSFSEDQLRNPHIRRLMAACEVHESVALGPARSARVILSLTDGRTLAREIATLKDSANGTIPASLQAKVMDCMHHAGSWGVDPEILYAAFLPEKSVPDGGASGENLLSRLLAASQETPSHP